MSEIKTIPLLSLIVTAMILCGFAFWSSYFIWDECREAGHSVLYCIRMVTR